MLTLNESIESLHQVSRNKRRESEAFLQVLSELALEQEIYSKALDRIKNHPGLKSSLFNDLRSFIADLSQRSRLFSENLTTSIVTHFKDLITVQSHSLKNQYLEAKKLGKYMIKKYNKVNETMEKYLKSCQECEKVAFALDGENSQPKKEKIFQRMQGLKKEVDSSKLSYQKSVTSYNSTSIKFQDSMSAIISAYNFHEEKRCKCFEESLIRLSEYLSSLISSFSPPVFALSKLSPHTFGQEPFSLEELSVEEYEGIHPLFQGTARYGFRFSVLETAGVAQGTQLAVEELFKQEIGDIVTKAWNGTDLTSDDYCKFNMRIKEPMGRKAWAWSMNLRRAQGNFEIGEKGFGIIGELMLAALNNCELTQDTYITKNCIILSQTFYKESKAGKVYLQSYIMGHSIWQNFEYWVEVVKSAIHEELKKQGLSNLSVEEKDTEHEKHLVFCQLVSFGHIMLSFHISIPATQKLLYDLALSYNFSASETDDIMFAVNDSMEAEAS
jgi:hypothetical protein